MESAAAIAPLEKSSEKQQTALVNLLADEDPVVYQAVREKILSFGEAARSWLRPHALSSDPLRRRRVHDVRQRFIRLWDLSRPRCGRIRPRAGPDRVAAQLRGQQPARYP